MDQTNQNQANQINDLQVQNQEMQLIITALEASSKLLDFRLNQTLKANNQLKQELAGAKEEIQNLTSAVEDAVKKPVPTAEKPVTNNNKPINNNKNN